MALLHLRRHSRVLSRVFSSLACTFLVSASAPPDWPQWRGPLGSGVSDQTGLPVTWNARSPNIKWHCEIPGVGLS